MLDQSDSTVRPALRSDIIAQEFSRYAVDITTLPEIRLADEGDLTEKEGSYTFFWKDLPDTDSRIIGARFLIQASLVLQLDDSPIVFSERPLQMRLSLTECRQANIFSYYAPTLVDTDGAKNTFYDLIDAGV